MHDLNARKMQKADLGDVVSLLADDELGRFREERPRLFTTITFALLSK